MAQTWLSKPGKPYEGHKQRKRDQREKKHLRELEDQKIRSVNERLAAYLEDQPSLPMGDEDARGTYEHFMTRLRRRIERAVKASLMTYEPETSYFVSFWNTFNAFCRHALALKADAPSFYIERELRHVLDRELAHFAGVLRTLDRRKVDAKTYEAILKQEIAAIMKIDMGRTALAVIRGVESRLVDLALHSKPVPNRSAKGYGAVMCRIGDEKRTNCFLILDSSRGDMRIVALQTPKKFAAHQKKSGKPKSGLTKRKQRFSNRPECLRSH